MFFVYLGCFLCSSRKVSALLPCILLGVTLMPFHNIVPFTYQKKKEKKTQSCLNPIQSVNLTTFEGQIGINVFASDQRIKTKEALRICTSNISSLKGISFHAFQNFMLLQLPMWKQVFLKGLPSKPNGLPNPPHSHPHP